MHRMSWDLHKRCWEWWWGLQERGVKCHVLLIPTMSVLVCAHALWYFKGMFHDHHCKAWLCCLLFQTRIVRWSWLYHTISIGTVCHCGPKISMLIMQNVWTALVKGSLYTCTLRSIIALHQGCIHCIRSTACIIFFRFNGRNFITSIFFLYTLLISTARRSVAVTLGTDM